MVLAASPAQASAYHLGYAGRLTTDGGQPLTGPAAITVRFFGVAQGGQPLVAGLDFPATPIVDGAFSLNINLSIDDLATIFSSFGAPVYIEVEAAGKVYPRQPFLAVPAVLRAPTDGATLAFNSAGQLGLATSGPAAPNQFLTKDADGALIWATPGGLNAAGSGVSALNVTGPLVSTEGLSPKLSLPPATAVASGYLSAADWRNFAGKLGTTGGTLTGALSMSGNRITAVATPVAGQDAATKAYADGHLGGLPLSLAGAANQDVLTWSPAGYSLAPQMVTVTGGAITSLGGDGSSAPLLAVQASGTAAAWTATPGTQTLTLPLASTGSGVAAGLLGNSDYLAFSSKQNFIPQTSVVNGGSFTTAAQDGLELKAWGAGSGQTGSLRFDALSGGFAASLRAPDAVASDAVWTLPAATAANGQVLTTNGSGVLSWASGVAPTGTAGGDLTGSYPNPSLAAVGTAGSYTKVIVDGKGRVTFGTTATAADLPLMGGDFGSGGRAGLVPASSPGAGSASFLQANGAWTVPAAAGVAGGDLSGNYPAPTLTATGVTAGTYAKVGVAATGRVVGGFGLSLADVPNLSMAAIISGVLPNSLGGTGVSSTAIFPSTGVVVTEAASEVLTNKILSGNTINGASTISGQATITTTGTLTAAAATAAAALTIQGSGTYSNIVLFNDRGTLNGVALRAPHALSSSTSWTLPASDGTTGQYLTTNAAGSLSWSSGVAASGTVAGDLTGSLPNPQLAATGVGAGTYAKVAVDAKGRVINGNSLAAADLPGLSTAVIATGTLAVSSGGTGVTTLPLGGVVYGNGTGSLLAAALGPSYQVLTVSPGGLPVFGPLAVGQAAAVSGLLPTASGGTGTASSAIFPVSGVVVTEAATESLSAKTLTAAVISGASTISGPVVINTSGSVTAGAISSTTINAVGTLTAGPTTSGTAIATILTSQGHVTLRGNGTIASSLVFNDSGTVNAVAFKAPDTLSGSTAWALPGADGGSGAYLTTNGAGTLGWTTVVNASGTAGGDLSGYYPNPVLISSGVTAGTYTKLTVDSKGRVTTGTSLAAGDLPGLPATSFQTGTFLVAQGGTGLSAPPANSILLGSGSISLGTIGPGSANQVFRVPTAGTLPAFGAIDLTQAGAVSGSLGVGNGGTGATTASAPRSALGVAAAGANSDITALNGLTTQLPVTAGATGQAVVTANSVVYGSGTAALQYTGVGSQYQVLQESSGTVPIFAAVNLSQAAAVSGVLPIANGGTGLGAVPGLGQIPIGSSGTFSLATLTPGNGLAVTNAAGTVTIALNESAATFIASTGATMTGALTLPAGGLMVGTTLAVAAGGNIGINTTAPAVPLDVNGFYHLAKYSAAPAACTASNDVATALTANYTTCICATGAWMASGVNQACVWALQGEADFTTQGTYTWVVPAGVTLVDVVAVGGGGGGGNGASSGGGGGGGGLCYVNNITVTPGTSITVVVGAGGFQTFAGGNSSFNGSTITAYGGGAGSSGAAGAGGSGSASGGVCNSGGAGGGFSAHGYGGGGGAAGYSGSGGAGGNGSNSGITSNQTAGSGGGGGGGGGSSNTTNTYSFAAGGGGVGLSGVGASGAAGGSSTGSGAGQTGGGGGSGGANAVLNWSTGGNYGGGSGAYPATQNAGGGRHQPTSGCRWVCRDGFRNTRSHVGYQWFLPVDEIRYGTRRLYCGQRRRHGDEHKFHLVRLRVGGLVRERRHGAMPMVLLRRG